MASVYSQMRVPQRPVRVVGIEEGAAWGPGAIRRREIRPDRAIVE
jgi:hypothetical protein